MLTASIPPVNPRNLRNQSAGLGISPHVRAFLANWISDYGSKAGRIMKVIGFNGFDPTLSQAIVGGHELRAEVIPQLEAWLNKQGFR